MDSALPNEVWVIGGGLLGLIFGSFTGALCSRWPQGRSVMTGRSQCDNCGKQLGLTELIPLLSFTMQRGKCRSCRTAIDPMQFVAELSAMAIGIIGFAALAWQDALIFTVMGWLLLPLIILDFRHLWLPNRLSFVVGFAGLLIGYFWAEDYDWRVQIISAAIIFTAMEILRRGFLWLRNVEGMGAGDPKLLAAIALWLPPLSLPYLLLLASGGGLLLLLIIPNDGDIRAQKLPLGSLLGISAIALLFCHFRFGWF